jgi:hypothetical protein
MESRHPRNGRDTLGRQRVHQHGTTGRRIATNLSPENDVLRDASGNPNPYVIKAETFPTLYQAIDGENEFGSFFKARNVVDAVYLSGGFDILAPWGEKQIARRLPAL